MNWLAFAKYFPPVNKDCVTKPVSDAPEPLGTIIPLTCSATSIEGNGYLSPSLNSIACPLNKIGSVFFNVGSIKTFRSHLTLYKPFHSSGISVPSANLSTEPSIDKVAKPLGVSL